MASWTTGLAFGNVDDDPAEELAFTRTAAVNERVWWSMTRRTSSRWYVTGKLALDHFGCGCGPGDVDGDGRDELGYHRRRRWRAHLRPR